MKLKKLMNGSFNMLAVDQRGSFVEMLKLHNSRVNSSLVKSVKKELISVLSPFAGAVLIDPLYCRNFAEIIKKNSALLFCLEKSGAKKTDGGLLTDLEDNFSVFKAKKLGADAVKLNVFFNPLAKASVVSHQKNLVKKIGFDCRKNNIDFLLEIIVYPFSCSFEEFVFQKPLLILSSVDEFSKREYNVSVLKLQFPCDLDYVRGFNFKTSKKKFSFFSKKDCAKFCSIISSKLKIPWVLLSAGVDFDIFVKQLKIAMDNGCSGFLAGRAVWKGALSFSNHHVRTEWIEKKGVSNMNLLNKIVGVSDEKR
jgi:tagatose 1,6-diphosphate aldolase